MVTEARPYPQAAAIIGHCASPVAPMRAVAPRDSECGSSKHRRISALLSKNRRPCSCLQTCRDDSHVATPSWEWGAADGLDMAPSQINAERGLGRSGAIWVFAPDLGCFRATRKLSMPGHPDLESIDTLVRTARTERVDASGSDGRKRNAPLRFLWGTSSLAFLLA